MKLNAGAFVQNAAMGAIGAVVTDGVAEVSKLPVLNQPAIFGGGGFSNTELILYGTGTLMTVLGIFAAVSKKKVAGFGPELIGTGVGVLVGTNLYDNVLAGKLGIR